MAAYDFQADDGEIIEEHFPMRGDIPETVERSGKVFRRVFSPGIAARVKRYDTKLPHDDLPLARTLPTRDVTEGVAKDCGGRTIVEYPDGGRSDADGVRIIADRKDRERELRATGFKET